VGTASKKAIMTERRTRVAKLLVSGMPYNQIARRENVAVSTISNDVKAILEQWHEEMKPRDRWRWIAIGMKKLSELDLTLSSELHRQKDVKEEGKVVGKRYAHNMEVRLKIIDRMLRLAERRSKLLGLDAPTKRIQMEITIDDILRALPPEFREEVRRELVGADATPGTTASDFSLEGPPYESL